MPHRLTVGACTKAQRSAPAGLDRRTLIRLSAALGALPLFRALPSRAAVSAFIKEVAPGVFVHQGIHALFAPENQGNISNIGFVVGSEAVAVIDTGGSAIVGEQLKQAIRTITDRPIAYVINTHMHPDHIFGNAAFVSENPAFVAHHKMARGLAARQERYMTINKGLLGDVAFEGVKIVMPTLGIDAKKTIDLGGRTLELDPQKTAHTDNDLTVRDVKTNTLFMGDLLFSGHVPTIDGSIKGWLSVLDGLVQQPAERVVPGHGPASMGWPDGAAPLQKYLNQLAGDVRMLIKDGKTIKDAMATAGQPEKGAWQLFDDYNARNASAAFAELEWE